MPGNNTQAAELVLAVLLFPASFQHTVLAYSWGAGDTFWLLLGKRLFLLLPTLAFIAACWLTIASVVTVIVRPNRRHFLLAIFMTWWDLGKAVAAFWGGIFNFVLRSVLFAFQSAKVAIAGIWTLAQHLIIVPFRTLASAGSALVRARLPWIAIMLTLVWCLIETAIFTYVTTPLVIDTFANLTGETFREAFLQVPLAIFLFFIVLGSYAVLSTFMDAVRKRDIASVLGIGAIEFIVMAVEVVFLYREFVDSLVPWIAQHAENFEPGIWTIIGIGAFTWFGIRSLSWFLFASHGTPAILAVISGKGLPEARNVTAPVVNTPVYTGLLDQIRADFMWFDKEGEALLSAFMLPPLHIIGGIVNFCSLLISGRHLFEIPFKDLSEIRNTSALLSEQRQELARSDSNARPVSSFGMRKQEVALK